MSNHLTCSACRVYKTTQKQSTRPWFASISGLLLLLLPKCPFCVVAYTTSMAICGAPALTEHHTDWGAWLSLGLAAICLFSIARNYRGPGTRLALCIATLGVILLLTGLYTPHALLWYYIGAALLFLGSLYNGRGYRWFNRLLAPQPSMKTQPPVTP